MFAKIAFFETELKISIDRQSTNKQLNFLFVKFGPILDPDHLLNPVRLSLVQQMLKNKE